MEKVIYPTLNLRATGERIMALRKERGITVRQLSNFMGFHEPKAVYKWQKGECLPTVDNLYAMSKLFGVSIEEILVDNGESSSKEDHVLYAA